MSDSGNSDAAKDGKKRKWTRGSTMTAHKRAKQFPEDMEVRGDAMWCKFCACPVKFTEKSTAAKHLQSDEHARSKLKNAKLVVNPGASAPVQSPPEPVTEPSVQGMML